ncbi:hypothetical protein RI054_45g154670 [Pseudoscourfieldia marina]
MAKKALEQLTSHGTLDAEVARESMKLVCDVPYPYTGHKHAFENGGTELVVAAMRAHPNDTEVQKQGTKTLQDIVPAPEGLNRLTKCGGLECIVAAIRAHPNSTDLQVELTVQLKLFLFRMFLYSDEMVPSVFDTVDRLGECGAVETFTSLFRTYHQKGTKVFNQYGEKLYDSRNERLFSFAKDVLHYLLATPSNRERFEECDGTELVVAMMRTLKDDGKVYQLCMDLLERMTFDLNGEDKKQRAISQGVAYVAQNALTLTSSKEFCEHLYDFDVEDLEKKAKLVLGNLAVGGVPANSPGLTADVDLPGAIGEEGHHHNAPGSWDYFISHFQKESSAIALDLFASLKEQGKRCWLDVKMDARGEAAMEEGVRNSATFVAVISEEYFGRRFCLKELDWAVDAGVPVQPVVSVDLKKEIGALLGNPNDSKESITPCPERFRAIGSTDFITLDRSDSDYWEVGVKKIIKAKPLAILKSVAQGD